MPTDTRTLSNSDFKVARDCPTKLFYKESGGYASVNDDDQYLALLAQGGYMIEQLAKARYPHGREMGESARSRAGVGRNRAGHSRRRRHVVRGDPAERSTTRPRRHP